MDKDIPNRLQDRCTIIGDSYSLTAGTLSIHALENLIHPLRAERGLNQIPNSDRSNERLESRNLTLLFRGSLLWLLHCIAPRIGSSK